MRDCLEQWHHKTVVPAIDVVWTCIETRSVSDDVADEDESDVVADFSDDILAECVWVGAGDEEMSTVDPANWSLSEGEHSEGFWALLDDVRFDAIASKADMK